MRFVLKCLLLGGGGDFSDLVDIWFPSGCGGAIY